MKVRLQKITVMASNILSGKSGSTGHSNEITLATLGPPLASVSGFNKLFEF